jgi:valyl-tRNA synthetase
MNIPERPSLEGLEAKWTERWEAQGTYRFDRSKTRGEVYSIDTPPPTVSGSLHIGHVFSYTQTDVTARFHRMRGKAVFYPIGWDDNGLPTERRVQNFYGVVCDPEVPYDPAYVAPEGPADPKAHKTPISRPNFVDLCIRLSAEDEKAYESLWRRLGFSYDWSQQYTTIGRNARRAAQRAFLRELARGEIYRSEAPTLWDVDFRSAIAQAELKDQEIDGLFYKVRFGRIGEGGKPDGSIEIETTRPELIPACVALVAHPDDARYQPLFGKEVLTPLFGVPVPVRPHPLAEPEKGTGIAMVCTFGDLTDVIWWRELQLATRTVVGRDGRLRPAPFGGPGWESVDAERAAESYGALEGLTARQAQRKIAELLAESGDLVGEPKPIRHAVKFYEYGTRPLEIVSSEQWFIKTMERREALLAKGRELTWHPGFMRARFDSWVNGLTGDWNISRQRFFGVPFPVWYPVDENGDIDSSKPVLASEDSLPVDPSTDVPPGFSDDQRGKPGGFVADPDVMDTWATSSLTPQIAGGWEEDNDLFARVFPMDLRPQAHEIIRTWLFSTVVRSLLEHDSLPFFNAGVSGWILDPDRKKLSKSSGIAFVPHAEIDKYGADGMRHWAASARLGVDTTFKEEQLQIGRRLAIKILNASRFALSRAEGVAAATTGIPELGAAPPDHELAPLDSSLLARLGALATESTEAFENYDQARALERTEAFFWSFCDDYLELVKNRAYGDTAAAGTISAKQTLITALSVLLRLLAPVLPMVTEEVWSWWQAGSIHVAQWPDGAAISALAGDNADRLVLSDVAEVLAAIRRAKSSAKLSVRSAVAQCTVTAPPDTIARIELARSDLCDAGNVADLRLVRGDPEGEIAVEITLAEGD